MQQTVANTARAKRTHEEGTETSKPKGENHETVTKNTGKQTEISTRLQEPNPTHRRTEHASAYARRLAALMPCYNPWPAWELDNGDVVLFPRTGQRVKRELPLPCSSCVGCRLERSRQWAIRCIHENQMHEESCFITLTYNDESKPSNSLQYTDFQKFLKRLRKKIHPKKIRFFMCGEYGEQNTRPHFHACIFGHNFADREPIRKLSNGSLYRSATLESLWPFGYSTLGAVTFESAAYVARYVMKKVTGDLAKAHYTTVDTDGEMHERTPEFTHMSLKPGIGATWLDKYYSDVYPTDEIITNGHAGKPPRYYDNRAAKQDPQLIDEMKAKRFYKTYDNHLKGENTTARLKTRETVTRARLGQLKRKL